MVFYVLEVMDIHGEYFATLLIRDQGEADRMERRLNGAAWVSVVCRSVLELPASMRNVIPLDGRSARMLAQWLGSPRAV